MSTNSANPKVAFLQSIKHFPPVIDNKIQTSMFLEASRDLVTVIDKLGKLFSPVTYDMLGNIEKLNKYYATNKEKHITLQDMILKEKSEGQNIATDALLWLTRAIHFTEVVFTDVVNQIKNDTIKESMKDVLTNGYKQTLKTYHGWMGQQLFSLISRMCPCFSSVMTAFGYNNTNRQFAADMENLLNNITKNRVEIQNFYNINNLDHHEVI